MRHDQCTEREAYAWLQPLCPAYKDWTADFASYLRTIE